MTPGPDRAWTAAASRPNLSRHSTLAITLDRISKTLAMSARSLWLHRLRSLLTVLGIVFGVSSVIAMLAIGEGASFEAQEQIKNLGSQNIILRSVKPPDEQKASQNQQNFILDYGLKYQDIKSIQATIPGVTVVVPGRIMREYIWNIARRTDCEVLGTVPWYPEIRNQRIASGRFFTDQEMETLSNVCVLGSETAASLFPLDEPLGRDVRMGSDYYRVIGVMEPAARNSKVNELQGLGPSGAVNRMFIPLSTARTRFGEILMKQRSGSFEAERVELHEVTITVVRRDDVLTVAGAVKDLMEHNHKRKDYDVVVPLELLKRAERTKQIFNIVLGSIAAISLLVGGIGIMNIMLANVTERTGEIGIRRALGARKRDIIWQFLVEAVMLSASGGLLGVGLGIAIPKLVTAFAGMVTIIAFWSPPLAFIISAVVGVVFGLYPAFRAANMDPVEALRHE